MESWCLDAANLAPGPILSVAVAKHHPGSTPVVGLAGFAPPLVFFQFILAPQDEVNFEAGLELGVMHPASSACSPETYVPPETLDAFRRPHCSCCQVRCAEEGIADGGTYIRGAAVLGLLESG